MTKISQWVTTMASKTPGSAVSLVGQGSFLDKPPLHVAGYMGENPNSIPTSHDGCCPVCKIKGQTQALKTYRINFTQSIFLCTNPQCIYPLGYTPLDNIIANTADLKRNSSPNKQKKRRISTLSPTSVPCEKRTKIDVPIFGDSQTVQADLCEELPGFPILEREANSPARLKDGLKEDSVSHTQNVTGPTNTFSSFALQDEPSFPVLPMEPPSGSDGLPAIQENNQEVLQNGDLEETDTLRNASLLPLPPESDLMANKVDKEQEIAKPSSEMHMMNDPSQIEDNTPSHVSLPTPVLQNLQQECQVEENSSKQISILLGNIENLPDSESGLAQFCESVKDDLSLLETPKEQMEHVDGLTDEMDVEASSCHESSLQYNPIEVSRNTVTSELHHEEPVQQMKDSLQNVPPTCPEAAVQENHFGITHLSTKEQMENVDSLTDKVGMEASSCNKSSLQYSPIEVSKNTVSPELHHEEPAQQMKDSVLDVPPPTCPEAAVQENHFRSTDLSSKEQMENVDSLTDKVGMEASSCNESSLQYSPIDGSGNTVFSELHHEEPVQQMKDSLLDVPPPTCPEAAVLENHFGITDLSSKEQMENVDSLTDKVDIEASSCNESSLQYSPIEVSKNTVSSELHHEEPVQQMKDSVLDVPPPTCPEAAVQENHFGSTDLSKSLQMMQESCEMMDSSQSPDDVLQESPAGHWSTDLWKPVSSTARCVVDNSEKGQSSLPLCDQHAESLATDSSDTPMDLTSPDVSVVSTEDPSPPSLSLPSNILQDPLPESQGEEKALENTDSPANSLPSVKDQAYADAAVISLLASQLSKTLDMTQTCQKNDMATPVGSSLDSQPVCHPNDVSLEKESVSCNSSASVLRDDCSACRDAKSLHKMPLLSPQILLKDCLKCHRRMNTPSGSLQNTQTLDKNSESEVGSSLCGFRDATDGGKALAHGDAKSPNKMPLPKPQIVLQDCLKCHCGTNKSSLQDTQELDTNSACGVRDTTVCDQTSPNKDGKPLKKMALSGAKILLKDCLKCHCGMNTPSKRLLNTQELDKNSALEVDSSLCGVMDTRDADKLSSQSDSHMESKSVATVQSPTPIPTIESKSQLAEQKKTFYENTVLPDLLLDIQPEHRMDEPLSAAPSPACDATECTILPSETTKQDVPHKEQVVECDNVIDKEETNDTLSDTYEEDSRLSDTMEASCNSEGLADGNDSMEAKTDDPEQVVKTPAFKQLKITERRLQWKNKHSLCWLDCILSALVQSKTLSHFVAGGHTSKESVIHNLFTRYDEATAMFLKSLKKRKKTAERRPRYEKCLHEVRMGIFEKVKPLLKCKLGSKESPVFAFPLLLNQDPQTEKLFAHTFMWHFKCNACGYSYQQRCHKILTTFTKALPGWRPLNAVHKGPCNKCKNTDQKRTMVLERLNSMFMVHFVEGLPSSDLSQYSFQFQGRSYEVKSVIKYRNKHFSTWISNDDGTWLESDDLRGSFCRRHQKFRVRAADIHIVIWERTDANTFEENEQLGATEQESEFHSANVSLVSEDESFHSVGAAELSPPPVPSTVPPVALNTSNPLAGMEGYADDDVITLTLVEIPFNINGQPVVMPTVSQPADTCTTQREGNHTSQPVMSANIQRQSQEACPLPSPISSGSGAQAAPLKSGSFVLQPVGTAIATSTPNPQHHKSSWRGVGKWMTQLINKDNSILNSNLLAARKSLPLVTCPPLKVTDPSGAPRKAQNFNGFQGRSTSRASLFPSNASQINQPCFSTPKEKGTSVATPSPAPTASRFRTPASTSLEYGKQLLKEGGSSNGDKIGKLRLKLLKKLKAKKNELATLEKLSKMQGSGAAGAQTNGVPHGGFNRKEHLQGFLHELQEHIDNADNESVCTMSSSTSICSSPGDAEFFAELFSPPPVKNQPDDGRYLEMLADGCGIASASQLRQADDQQQFGNVSQTTSGTSHSGPTTRDESLNLMSSSTLAVLNEDNGHFDFDDYF